ncbi:MAG: hypothetical protein IT247_04050 [Bacteroidia bacterium]|nr:hypothetical protein [Bacteroidia bacterium]
MQKALKKLRLYPDMKQKYLLFLFAPFLLFACNPSRSLTKKGQKLETAGMYREAANYYYDAVRYNNRNIEAQIGLKNTGQKVLNDYYEEFFRAYNTDKLKEAVYAYRNAEKYFKDLGLLGVYLKWDDHYQDDYKTAVSKYLEQKYNEGLEFLKKDDFEGAEKSFKEVLNFDPSYKDIKSLKETATLEPLYRSGVDLLSQKKYVKAYDQFNKICSYTCKYKNTEQLRAEALEKGTVTIGFFIDDKKANKAVQRVMAGLITDEITKSNNPFIQLIDRDNIDKLIAEQKLNMSGVVDENKAISAGKLIGIQNAFFINIIEYTASETKPTKNYKLGYEIYNVTYKNATGETLTRRESAPFYYNEYYSSITFKFAAEFKLVSSETGKILYNKTFADNQTDEVHYAVPMRTVKLNQIYPINDILYGNTGTVNSFRNMFSGRQQLKTNEELQSELLRKIARNIAYDILEYHRQISYQ